MPLTPSPLPTGLRKLGPTALMASTARSTYLSTAAGSHHRSSGYGHCCFWYCCCCIVLSYSTFYVFFITHPRRQLSTAYFQLSSKTFTTLTTALVVARVRSSMRIIGRRPRGTIRQQEYKWQDTDRNLLLALTVPDKLCHDNASGLTTDERTEAEARSTEAGFKVHEVNHDSVS